MFNDLLDPANGNNMRVNPDLPHGHFRVEIGLVEFGDRAWSPEAQRWCYISTSMVAVGHPVKDFRAVVRQEICPVTEQAEIDYKLVKAALPRGNECSLGCALQRDTYEAVDQIISNDRRMAVMLNGELDMRFFRAMLAEDLARLANERTLSPQQYLNFVAVHMQKEQVYGKPI